MLSTIVGEVTALTSQGMDLQVGPIGVFVFYPRSYRAQVGQRKQLWTHLIMKEDSLCLYGFESLLERNLFLKLIKVHGVGPKLALQILEGDTETFVRACQEQNKSILCQFPGVGAKTAARLLTELDLTDLPLDIGSSLLPQARQILQGLGFGLSQIDLVLKNNQHLTGLDNLVKVALQQLGEQRGKLFVSTGE